MKKGALGAAALAVALVIGNIAFQGTHHVGPAAAYPPKTIPGVINPNVTQGNIQSTICVSGWTATIRPSTTYTNNLKLKQLQAGLALQGDSTPADYEEDHYISIEIGGNPTDPKNLWPMPYNISPGGARQKDQVENFLKREVCAGKMTLAQAQKAITTDWYAIYSAGSAASDPTHDENDQ